MVAMVGEQGEVLCRSTPFGEDESRCAHLFELLGPPEGCLLALEATGHYWRDLFVALSAKGYAVAVLNPLKRGALPRRSSNGPRPTRSMRWESRGFAHRRAVCYSGQLGSGHGSNVLGTGSSKLSRCEEGPKSVRECCGEGSLFRTRHV